MIRIITFQDLEKLETEQDRMEFVFSAIGKHQQSDQYKKAEIAQQYADKKNVTIARYQKILYTLTGEAVPDNYTANHKCKSGFFNLFITQEASYEVGNGVAFSDESTKKKLGKKFESKLYKAVKSALTQGVVYAFYNYDHVEFFKLTEFVPLLDEETGKLRAGVRYWQLDAKRPLRATLYEVDGFTDYIRDDGKFSVLNEKRGYKQKVVVSEADGEQIEGYENYPGFPIIPLYGNSDHISELEGRREEIDCYDLIKSGFANDLDDASMIYWTLENCGGMGDLDLAKFIERMKTLRAAVIGDEDGGARAEAHTIDVPYQSREAYLSRLEVDLYRDFMALDTGRIAAGQITATQIRAAYEALNEKANELEMCLYDFFDELFEIAGIDDIPEFTRSKIMNTNEEIGTIVMSEPFIGNEEATKKICSILGMSDKYDEIMAKRISEEAERIKLLGGLQQ